MDSGDKGGHPFPCYRGAPALCSVRAASSRRGAGGQTVDRARWCVSKSAPHLPTYCAALHQAAPCPPQSLPANLPTGYGVHTVRPSPAARARPTPQLVVHGPHPGNGDRRRAWALHFHESLRLYADAGLDIPIATPCFLLVSTYVTQLLVPQGGIVPAV